MAAAPTENVSRRTRLADAVMTRSDIGVAELREKLQNAENLQQAGKIPEAVQELLAVGQFYGIRNQPMKAVQVLRQAARLQPEAIEVQLNLGESLAQIKLVEDAAQAYRRAATLLEGQQRYAEWLAVAKKMLDLDPDDLHARLRCAEDLSRAGRSLDAAEVFRSLAEALLTRGETEDWEKVAERLLHHDPSDTTIAHDLALHYVRSGRHALALPKLVLCYEVEPGDAELVELIIDTLESLGQREKAAAICRQLLASHRRTGLHAEAERLLEHLFKLDPDDAQAREYVGLLAPSVEGGTVIDFEPGAVPPSRPQSGVGAARSGDTTGYVAQSPEAARLQARTGGAGTLQARHEDEEADFGGATVALIESPRPQRAISPPVPTHQPTLQTIAAAPADDDGADWPDDEAGFDFEERTVMEESPAALARLAQGAAPRPVAASASSAPVAQVAAAAQTTSFPAGTASQLPADQSILSSRARSNSLPRPRLARRAGTMTELPSTVRDMSKDLSTLDFFIERGFYDSAVALLDELQRRYPDSIQLEAYHLRIERMQRG